VKTKLIATLVAATLLCIVASAAPLGTTFTY
jgi:hypothetical protein